MSTPRRLVAHASIEHARQVRAALDAPTEAMTRDDLTTIPRAVTRQPALGWRMLAHWAGTFAWGCFAVLVVIGLAAWVIPVWAAL